MIKLKGELQGTRLFVDVQGKGRGLVFFLFPLHLQTKLFPFPAEVQLLPISIWKNCDTVTVTGEEVLHLIYPLTPQQLYFTFVDCYFHQFSVYNYVVFVYFMSSSSYAQCACRTWFPNMCMWLHFLPSLFSNLWSDQLSARF